MKIRPLLLGLILIGAALLLAPQMALTQDEAKSSEQQLLAAMSGHVCRCTGYQGIRRAVKKLADADGGEAS